MYAMQQTVHPTNKSCDITVTRQQRHWPKLQIVSMLCQCEAAGILSPVLLEATQQECALA